MNKRNLENCEIKKEDIIKIEQNYINLEYFISGNITNKFPDIEQLNKQNLDMKKKNK